MSESETLENIGGFPYILDYLSVYLPYTVISGTSAILGLIGNAILISSVLISKKLRTNPTCILITNIGTLNEQSLYLTHFYISFHHLLSNG